MHLLPSSAQRKKKHTMKLLFLSFDYLTQPLGIATLSAVLHLAGHHAEVAALGDTARQEALLGDFKPDILCLSLITGQHPLFIERARQIKAAHPQLLVLAGGPHPTFYPECIEEPCIDAICRGEGDIALPALVAAVARGGNLPENLANWWIKQPDGTISRNDVAPLVEDLDLIPFPDRGIFDRARPGDQPVTAFVMAVRGCPFNCSYCFNHAYRELYRGRGNICRRRGVAHVVAEIRLLRQCYPLQMVVFQDDTFNLDKNWLREFAGHYASEIGLPFHCHLRADLLDAESAELLRQAGCISVKLGLEAGREEVRNGILQRGMTLEQFENACALLHKSGIRFATENILAVPGTTLDDDLFTYSVNRRVRPQHSFATLMQVYPRTGIAAYALCNGFAALPVTEFPATFYEDSAVRITDKEKRGRLRALFALGVSLHLPALAVRLLIELPLRKLYEFVDRLWKGYCLRFRIYPYKQSLGSFVRDVRRYLEGKYY
jgi:anaerobic magnesium-protoporphyrin IX monomethyl ester cyclase